MSRKIPVRGREVDGEYLQEQCFIKGLTQAALAEKAGLSKTTVNKAFQGGVLDPDSFRKLVEAIFDTPDQPERARFMKQRTVSERLQKKVAS